jgi:EmrB/QacA subfamily drug resistance transporter
MPGPHPSNSTTPVTLAPRRTRLVLLVVSISLMTVVSAVSGLNVALPSLARATGASQTELTWIVDAYTVIFAGLLLASGAIGDRLGRKGILLVGLAIFGVAAGAAAFADTPSTLIALRAVMGIGAAAIMPTTLSVITTTFPENERPKAVGVWVGVAGGGAAIGVFVAALLLQWFEWPSFFWLNVALAAIGFVGTVLVVPPGRDEHPPRFDGFGAVLSLLAVGGIVFGIIEIPERGGDDPLALGVLAAGFAALIAFVLWEWRSPAPLLDPRLFAVRGFGMGSLSLAVQFFAAFGFFFAALQYLQFVAGLSPLWAAACLLPMPFILIPLARFSPRLAERFGYRRVAPVGLLLIAAAFVVFAHLEVELNYAVFGSGMVLFATGMALSGAPSTTAITQSLPPGKQGVASAVNDTAREVGSALGIAVLGSILTATYKEGVQDAIAGLPPAIGAAVESSIAFTQSDRVAEFGAAAQPVIDAAQTAFLDGVTTALLVAAVVLAVTAAVTATFGPKRSAPEVADSHG